MSQEYPGRYLFMKPFPSTFVVFLLLILPAYTLLAQNPAIKPAPTPAATDSTRQIRSASDTIPATIRRNGIKVGTSVLTPDDDSTSLDKPDTLRVTAKQEAQIHTIIPKKATLRSVMLPGLGQAYNRQYYKIPFIYAGYGVMGYLFFKYRGLAQEAAIGYKRLLFGDVTAGAYVAYLDSSLFPGTSNITQAISVSAVHTIPDKVLIGGQYFYTSAGAKNAYDTYRRYRDLNVLLSIVLYAVNIVEANVAAHLKTFDLTDDISMLVEPNVIPMPGTGLVPGVRVAFTFK